MQEKFIVNIDEYQKPLEIGDLEKLDVVQLGADEYHFLHEGKKWIVQCLERDFKNKRYLLSFNGSQQWVSLQDSYDLLVKNMGLADKVVQNITSLVAPMPGLVLEILVNEGDEIAKGENLMILEAMKMENVLKSPADVVIKSISVSKGDAVEKAQILIHFA